ncbi:hypothetical protein ABZT49_00185 [Methylobacterium sp. EM32]|uniref:hypothetical protein n=1 Tax=Methylobacterium sp. EM32 TaxID=3163481 RepID=UPI0033B8B39D
MASALFYSLFRACLRRAGDAGAALIGAGLCAGGAGAADAPHLPPAPRRIVHADIVALDQLLVYNRFGSFNPYGMIFALRRDVSDLSESPVTDADICRKEDGTRAGTGTLEPGKVRLKDCRRARPLVLRANVGDIVEITVSNMLMDEQPDISDPWCKDAPSAAGTPPTRADARKAFARQCDEAAAAGKLLAEVEARGTPGDREAAKVEREAGTVERKGDWPATRMLSLAMPGLEPLPTSGSGIDPKCLGLDAARPGEAFTCRFRLEREGTHLFSSLAAPAGGEADAGSLIHGLFGALIVEPQGAVALRSQVTQAGFDALWRPAPDDRLPHRRTGEADYAAAVARPVAMDARPGAFPCGPSPIPVLAVARPCTGTETVDGVAYGRAEIVHGDLNAIVVPDPNRPLPPVDPGLAGEDLRTAQRLAAEARAPFREFTVIFHDELKTFFADNFKELGQFGQLSAARDGFAINYGASGAGPMILANRKRIGPAAACPECLYEEFFLESWANGDPALLEAFPDDPSNVHHSYLNDKVVFRNLHAGKETHIFHLHTHQWFAGNDENRGAYLDSQTIAPQQGYSYRIYHGGHDRHRSDAAPPAAQGWWEDGKGSGNRNRTVGDAIFHCHLYPHFAQGMWALWRVHDVLEDGSRVLPDGQGRPGLSVDPNPAPAERRQGSVDLASGRWLGSGKARGTPVPGLVPLPGEAAPLLPLYAPDPAQALPTAAIPEAAPVAQADAMPGYPYYIAGRPGHRAPQPPLDMARATGEEGGAPAGTLLDGGLPRHRVTGGLSAPSVLSRQERDDLVKDVDRTTAALAPTLVPRMLALGDFTSEYQRLDVEILPHAGTALERAAMAFHHDGRRPDGTPMPLRTATGAGAVQQFGAYPTMRMPPLAGAPRPGPTGFAVNGAPPAPGAPYADPCGAPTTLAGVDFRRHIGLRRATGQRDVFEDVTLAAAPDPAVAGDTALEAVRGRAGLGFVPDPGLLAFRRYGVSAVQFDMTVNRAGWHDPQARIAVLTTEADRWKEARSARAEPFFFRAFSGECIELRHTNELPKDLELDDFQLKVPTDTIGQHIHLVKFDVTSADGSGNGFNYEDATFAPDEILDRICAARRAGGSVSGETTAGAKVGDRAAECAALETARTALDGAIEAGDRPRIAEAQAALRALRLWRRKGADDRARYFQTTVQRWFADPILSNTGDGRAADRTLRTVFTHDHFGPSNIQQHGYYAALLIEPSTHGVERFAGPGQARADMPGRVLPPEPPAAGAPVAPALAPPADARGLVGARAVVEQVAARAVDPASPGPAHANSREFALAVADFALLYDGARQEAAAFGADARPGGHLKGLARLVGEAACTVDGSGPEDARDPDIEPGEAVPARRAGLCATASGAVPRDLPAVRRESGAPAAAFAGRVAALSEHAERWRGENGRPVAPPPRPEAFSQKHHDPYVVNYRNEPVPLRVGATDAGGTPLAFMRNPCTTGGPAAEDEAGRKERQNHRDVRHQREDEFGNLSNVFRSIWNTQRAAAEGHGDPCTPVVEAFARERVLLRMVQGAQEVQHTFKIEGLAFRRNVDQHYPTARPHLSRLAGAPRARTERCHDDPAARDGRPRALVSGTTPGAADQAYQLAFDALAAGCDNLLGYTSAQEIGLSEHFEVGARFSATSPGTSDLVAGLAAGFAAPAATASYALSPLRVRDPRPDASASANPLQNLTGTAPLLNADVVGGLRVRDLRDRREALDYLYSYGSADAIWNGAWGLLRIYDRPKASDVARCLLDPEAVGGFDACLADGKPVDDRFRPLAADAPPPGADGAAALEAGPPASAAAPPTVATSLPLVCPPDAKQVETIMVAVRAGQILDYANAVRTPGLPYDRADGLFDPDALMIASLPLSAIVQDAKAKSDIEPGAEILSNAEILQRGLIPDQATIRRLLQIRHLGVATPEPYVLRVNAGDCVNVLMINALTPNARRNPRAVRDAPGDALMPNIVPLNTDPGQTGGRGGIESTTRVTFTLPASLTSPRNGVPFPFGVNQAPPLRAEAEVEEGGTRQGCHRGGGRRCLPAASWITQTFYAGSLSVDAGKLVEALGPPWSPPPGEDGTPSPVAAIRVLERPSAGCAPDHVEFAVLTVLFCADPAGHRLSFGPDPSPAPGPGQLSAAERGRRVAEAIAAWLRPRQAMFLAAKPYAGGAQPIRVAGDLIGHASHGLVGTLVVEPYGATHGATALPRTGEDNRLADEETGPRRGAPFQTASAPSGGRSAEIGVPTVVPCLDPKACPVRIGPTTVQEHTLLYQDGLNLWTRAWGTPPVKWSYEDPPSPKEPSPKNKPWDDAVPSEEQGYSGHPRPDCPVCDDSYDLGEKAVSYRSAPFDLRLAGAPGVPAGLGRTDYPGSRTNLNAYPFPRNFLSAEYRPIPTPALAAKPGAEVMIRVVHPAGRARQRAFVAHGAPYDDLLPGFGSAHSPLLAPGKGVTASLCASRIPGTFLWRDGPQHITAAGVWGHLTVDAGPSGAQACAR